MCSTLLARGPRGRALLSLIRIRIGLILEMVAAKAGIRLAASFAVNLGLERRRARSRRLAVGTRRSVLTCLISRFDVLQAVPQQKAALATMAAFAASVLLSAAPAQADVKSTVCASNATAKICLKDSAKK